MESDAIDVFSKPAVPGLVKTRLVPPFTPQQAAQFHLAALDDVVAAADAAVNGQAEVHIAGDASALDEFCQRYPDRAVRLQRGADLGARLSHAFAGSFRSKAGRTLIVGSAHPSSPVVHLAGAFDRLRSADVVLGPAADGGYYAVAIRRESWPDARAIFHNVPWSTSKVLEITLQRARAARLEVDFTPAWYDVDRPVDLERLRRHAGPGSASAHFLQEIERSGGL